MNRLFGKKKATVPGPSLDDVSQGMTGRGDEIDDKIRKLDAQLADYKRKMNSTNSAAAKRSYKQKALQLLKQRKMYEKQREQLYGQQFNVDQAKFAIQSAKDNAQMVSAMKDTSKELKQAYKKIDINDVENLQDEMNDLFEMGEEVNEVLGQAYGVPEVDEDELMGELDALDDEIELGDTDEVPSYLKDAAEREKVESKASEENQELDELGLPKIRDQIKL